MSISKTLFYKYITKRMYNMPQDAINLYILTNELHEILSKGKINKVTMPEKDEIHFQIYSRSGGQKLLISTNPSSPRIHLTSVIKGNPLTPPSFCMLLRKYMVNSEIISISIEKGERIIKILTSHKNEMNDTSCTTLVIEIMARQSNMFLLDSQNNILGSLKGVSLEDTERTLLIGSKYQMPKNTRYNPFIPSDVELGFNGYSGENIQNYIFENFMGFAKQTIGEIIFSAEAPEENLTGEEIQKIKNEMNNFTTVISPHLYFKNKNVKDFSFKKYSSYNFESEVYTSFNDCLDNFYTTADSQLRINERSRGLRNTLKNAISRYEKKLKSQKAQLIDCENMEKNRIFGELITSNLYKVKRHDDSLVCENYHDNMNEITIKLQKNLSGSQNAQLYFKKYSKQKRTYLRVTDDLSDTENAIQSLKIVQSNLLRTSSISDLDLIKEDLIALGIISKAKLKVKKLKKGQKAPAKKVAEMKPLRYLIDGVEIYVGKNSLQNEFVSFKIAKNNDLWFHVNKYFGCHLVAKISIENISDELLVKCAEIAAFHSDAKNSEKAVIDYTLAKNLKKPPKGNLGLVIYHTNYSIAVTPNEHIEYIVK